MRMTLQRVLLRVALLCAGGAFMLWRAAEARRAARLLGGAEATLLQRIALVEALVGALALLTGAAVALSLRRRRPRKLLRLGGEGPAPDRHARQ
ncbi:hypothetical protein [Anaeromyxobacter paludicola]|uniref:Uncharacterized protein n=1 Tax=Anaeromyxobacter paludicola TaxID=2918171 RepID=A0ABN6N4W6_9BACT|nr:hypothetical protein [Anaeromyxobacter paludicola]BDG08201.1 hypothetical protein AMPC_13140 [Anaeromyxobacter paludicola]